MPNGAHFISKPFKIFLHFPLIYHSVLISHHSLNAQNFSSFSKLVRLLPIFMPLKLFLPCWDSFFAPSSGSLCIKTQLHCFLHSHPQSFLCFPFTLLLYLLHCHQCGLEVKPIDPGERQESENLAELGLYRFDLMCPLVWYQTCPLFSKQIWIKSTTCYHTLFCFQKWIV